MIAVAWFSATVGFAGAASSGVGKMPPVLDPRRERVLLFETAFLSLRTKQPVEVTRSGRGSPPVACARESSRSGHNGPASSVDLFRLSRGTSWRSVRARAVEILAQLSR